MSETKDTPDVRKGQGSVELSQDEFARRLRQRFDDPVFAGAARDIERITDLAWDGYVGNRKSPRQRKAGAGFADPDYMLSEDWLAARAAIEAAERRQKDPRAPARILLICGSPRSDQTCPGEMSKTFRLVEMARDVIVAADCECDLLDLSHLTSAYGRVIHPCKACVSTAMPLCNWPCSCYPNHAMGQVGDWMAEIYPRWAAAHGVMIVCPVNWYQAPSSLKLMIDRLVCADGGNPDPTSTGGKDVGRAKALELAGWPYPRHLAGRVFSVVVHGDAAGVETLRRILTDWLCDLGLIPAGHKALLGSYVGYYRPYATSHEDLDRDTDFQEEVANAARSLIEAVRMRRRGALGQPDAGLRETRPK